MSQFALELINITKRFPGVVANDAVTLRLRPGSIHAIVGENGTGKTTLMRIAYGEIPCDHGEVKIGGQTLGRGGTARAIALGLGMVHQHFMLIPTLSVGLNVVLGNEPTRHGRLLHEQARQRVREISDRFGLQVDPDALVDSLSVGSQQRVEILKVLERGARTLILDEPTAVLAPSEVEYFFTILRSLASQGHSIVLISHRLQEVLSIADEISVMRRGRMVAQVRADAADEAGLIRLIVGRDLQPAQRPDTEPTNSDKVLSVSHLSTSGSGERLHDVSFDVAAGEVLGVAGVEGNGQSKLAEVLMGLARPSAGRVYLQGEDVTAKSTAWRRRNGFGYVPADRLRQAVIAEMRVDENFLLGRQDEAKLRHGPWLRRNEIREQARRLLREYRVTPAFEDFPLQAFSGGNQQRCVLARELDRSPKFLLLAQPTRGVDVGGIEFIHGRILQARQDGRAVLLVSADLQELMNLSDRIAVLFEGKLSGPVRVEDASMELLGHWMTGTES